MLWLLFAVLLCPLAGKPWYAGPEQVSPYSGDVQKQWEEGSQERTGWAPKGFWI